MFAIWYKRSPRNEIFSSLPPFFFLQRCTRLRLKRGTSPPFWRVDEDLDKYLVSLWWASRKYKRRIPWSLLFRTAWPGTRHSCSGVEKRGEAWRKSRGMSGIFIGSSSFLEIRQPDLPLSDGKRIWSRLPTPPLLPAQRTRDKSNRSIYRNLFDSNKISHVKLIFYQIIDSTIYK